MQCGNSPAKSQNEREKAKERRRKRARERGLKAEMERNRGESERSNGMYIFTELSRLIRRALWSSSRDEHKFTWICCYCRRRVFRVGGDCVCRGATVFSIARICVTLFWIREHGRCREEIVREVWGKRDSSRLAILFTFASTPLLPSS